MSVWLTPDREPFFGGTYFPPRDGDARRAPGFLTLLARACTQRTTRMPDAGAGRGGRAGRRAVRVAHRAGRAAAAATRRSRRRASIGRRVDRSSGRSTTAHGGCGARPSSRATSRSACCCAQHRRTGDAARARDGDADARADGGGRHPRPARRRLPSLLDRRALAGAALREDALRQRAPGRRLPRGATR